MSGRTAASNTSQVRPPGVEQRARRVQVRWEIVGCALHGHSLVDTVAARRSGHEHLLVLTDKDVRWFRCLRCDGWLPLTPPNEPPTVTGEVEVPLRGGRLRDRYVLRLIALDRIVHFLVLAIVAVAIFAFAHDRAHLHGDYLRILTRLQGAVGGVTSDTQHHGFLHSIDELFAVSASKLYLYGAAAAIYGLVNAVEAFGLWRARRWAEYLTFLEVAALLPFTIIELTDRVSPVKIIGLVLDLAVAAYLLYAKRLFGVRGGGAADRRDKDRNSGWPALEAVTPHLAD